MNKDIFTARAWALAGMVTLLAGLSGCVMSSAGGGAAANEALCSTEIG